MSDDMINHPPHYKLGDREVIGITEHLAAQVEAENNKKESTDE